MGGSKRIKVANNVANKRTATKQLS